MNYGNILKNLREDYSYTQKQLGNLLNVRNTTISNWEKEITEPCIDDLIKIAKIFNVSIDYLLGIEEDQKNSFVNNTLNLNSVQKEFVALFKQLSFEQQSHMIGYMKGVIKESNKSNRSFL